MIQFDNFTLRLLSIEDLDQYFQLVENNRHRLEDFFAGTVSRTKTYEDTRRFLVAITKLSEERMYFPFILIDNSIHKIAGFFDLKNIDWGIPKSELGFFMDELYTNKGITTIAFRLLCDFCFNQYKFQKLYLRTHISNQSARRVAEKCGFEIEGTIRQDYKTSSGEIVDLIYYGRIK